MKPLLEQNVKLMAPPATQMSTLPVRVQDITSEVIILESPQLLSMVVKELDLTKEEKPKGLLSRAGLYLMTQGNQVNGGPGIISAALSRRSGDVDPEKEIGYQARRPVQHH